jgi:hypothetical protein
MGDRDCTGVPQEILRPCRSMQRASTRTQMRIAAPTTSSPRTPRRSPVYSAHARTCSPSRRRTQSSCWLRPITQPPRNCPL